MSIAYDLLKYLESKNYGIEGTNLFLGFEPDSPKNCITFYDEQATTPSESSCLKIDMFGIQVLVRNSNYNSGYEIINNIHKTVTGFGGRSLVNNGDVVSYITVETSPYSLGKDNDGYNQFTAHYNIRVQSQNDSFRL